VADPPRRPVGGAGDARPRSCGRPGSRPRSPPLRLQVLDHILATKCPCVI
jgi:hypothetical protein